MCSAGGLGQGAALGDVMGQRLLREGGLAALDRADRRRGMVVVRRGDQHDVEILVALVEHLAIVVVDLRLGLAPMTFAELLHGAREGIVIDIDQGHEVLAQAAAEGVAAHAARANHGHAQLLVVICVGQYCRGGELKRTNRRTREGRVLDELTSSGFRATC